jgi:hypothetical protein
MVERGAAEDVAARGAREDSGVARVTVDDFGATRGTIEWFGTSCGVGGVRGANPGGTRDAERWSASARGRNPGGTTGADMVASSVEPTELSGFRMVETGESDSHKKFRLVRWREAEKGKSASSNTTCRETMMRLVERSRHRYPL